MTAVPVTPQAPEAFEKTKDLADGKFEVGIQGEHLFARFHLMDALRALAKSTNNTVDDKLVELVGLALTNKDWGERVKTLLGL